MVDTEREHASDYIWKEHGFENRADPRVGVWMACRVTFLWHWLVGEILLLISIYTVYIYNAFSVKLSYKNENESLNSYCAFIVSFDEVWVWSIQNPNNIAFHRYSQR